MVHHRLHRIHNQPLHTPHMVVTNMTHTCTCHDAAQTLNKLQTCINAIGDRAVPTTAQWELLKTIATNH